jgi:hypothetical protein
MACNPQTQCPPDSSLMKAWTAYQETESFKNSLYWAMTEFVMRQERADELGVMNQRATPSHREQTVKGSLWASFMAGFAAAGGKISF